MWFRATSQKRRGPAVTGNIEPFLDEKHLAETIAFCPAIAVKSEKCWHFESGPAFLPPCPGCKPGLKTGILAIAARAEIH